MEWKEICNGCAECCGPVPFDRGFFLAHKSIIDVGYILKPWNPNSIVPVTETGDCVFLDESKLCKIYDERPEVCREYGEIPELPCPKKEELK